MNNELVNKTKVLFAQGDVEISRAEKFIKDNFDGKVRTCSRRAAGFYIDGLLNIKPGKSYGRSFMTHLKALSLDNSIPDDIKKSAEILIERISVREISGIIALENAKNIINYCKDEFKVYLEDK